MYSVHDTAEAVGFPIRKSADQSLFAAPRGLSQRTTSFIASQRQGIHRMPLRHLITLIVDARRALLERNGTTEKRPKFSSSFVRPRRLTPRCALDAATFIATLGQTFSSRCQKARNRSPLAMARIEYLLRTQDRLR